MFNVELRLCVEKFLWETKLMIYHVLKVKFFWKFMPPAFLPPACQVQGNIKYFKDLLWGIYC